jgi:hypothetical protein
MTMRLSAVCQIVTAAAQRRREAAGGHGLKDQFVDLNQQAKSPRFCIT